MFLLSEYEQRTAWKYESIHGSFHTAEKLTDKVNQDGSYAPFRGSTVVFRPGRQCLQIIQIMQRLLQSRLEGAGMLASPLPPSTIHMTLHDLLSPDTGGSAEGFLEDVRGSLAKAACIVEELKGEYAGQKIVMVADRIVNMVSKSLVLMLKPKTQEDYERLQKMYERFDGIVRLPYPLTPHITLAYYKPGMLDGDKLGRAVDYAQIVPENAPEFDFYPESLTAQAFLDMQSYMDTPELICFCCDGGLNRSVLAANILTHLAQRRGVPVRGEARSAYRNTQGQPIPQQVRKTLAEHDIRADMGITTARFLHEEEISQFTYFAALSFGAVERMSMMVLPEEKTANASRFFYGVKDPAYGEASYEQVFEDIYDRAVRYLDAFEDRYRQYVPPCADAGFC